ncbi:MAG: pyridine nucleotide-disulfide oxidoreductase, partial [Lachnospiraceae bacterium]|nr:pyridine nucleotide-disulfide oxidoreductase [Lachnospiraceae bacterium]
RYTVPSSVSLDRMNDLLTVRFRVGAVYQDSYVSVYFNDTRVMHNLKKIMAPGEMEQIILQKEKLKEFEGLNKITVKIEKE